MIDSVAAAIYNPALLRKMGIEALTQALGPVADDEIRADGDQRHADHLSQRPRRALDGAGDAEIARLDARHDGVGICSYIFRFMPILIDAKFLHADNSTFSRFF
jgi:hypothetical protein